MVTSRHKLSVQPGHILVNRPHDYEVVWSEQPAILREISAACKEADCKKVLILGPRTTVRLSVFEICTLGSRIAKMGVRIAVVELHDASNENVEFLENVVRNRGGRIQFFENEQDARTWLGIPCQ